MALSAAGAHGSMHGMRLTGQSRSNGQAVPQPATQQPVRTTNTLPAAASRPPVLHLRRLRVQEKLHQVLHLLRHLARLRRSAGGGRTAAALEARSAACWALRHRAQACPEAALLRLPSQQQRQSAATKHKHPPFLSHTQPTSRFFCVSSFCAAANSSIFLANCWSPWICFWNILRSMMPSAGADLKRPSGSCGRQAAAPGGGGGGGWISRTRRGPPPPAHGCDMPCRSCPARPGPQCAHPAGRRYSQAPPPPLRPGLHAAAACVELSHAAGGECHAAGRWGLREAPGQCGEAPTGGLPLFQ